MRTFASALICGLCGRKRSRQYVDRLSVANGSVRLDAEDRLRSGQHHLETLEVRRLLSVSPVGDADGNVERAEISSNVTTVEWNGETHEARADQWIIRLSNNKTNINKLQRRLRNVFGATDANLSRVGKSKFGILKSSFDNADIISQWAKQQGAIAYAEPDYIVTKLLSPNDPDYVDGDLWGLNNTGQNGGTPDVDIDAPEAWNQTTGSSSVVVAVIDTGVNVGHPDLAGNIWVNPGEIAGNSIDDDGNGFVDDVNGWDFRNNDNDPADGDGHGTHVAGTIGAVGNNGIGVSGVNWDVSIMALKFLNDDGEGSTSDAIAALDYVTVMKRDYGINIVATNNSWGGGNFSIALQDAITDNEVEDILFVAAAGNGGVDGIGDDNDSLGFYPASYTNNNVISVGSTDRNDNKAGSSNFGATSVDLMAPGVSIRSTYGTSSYATLSGTSMASPHVAGVAALIKARFPTATATEIKDAILAGVDIVPGLSGLSVTGGRLNALGALNAFVPPSEISGTVFNDVDGNGTMDGGDSPLTGRTVYIDANNNQVLDSSAQSFNSSDIPKIISSVGTDQVTSTLNVAGMDGAITDINVTLDITHTWDADLIAVLSAPTGQSVTLFGEVGGSGNNFTNTTLDDEAATSITASGAPFSGTFKPQQPLSSLDGLNPNGIWTLTITDGVDLDGGSLNSWSLNVTSAEHSDVTDGSGNYSFFGLDAGSYRLKQELEAGETQTAPGGDGSHLVSLLADEQETGWNFGLQGGGGGFAIEDFNDGIADGFTPVEGSWSVIGNRYEGLTTNGNEAISLFNPGFVLNNPFTFESTLNIIGGGGLWTNAMMIFDYEGPNDFKFVQMLEGVQQWRIGQYNGSYSTLASANAAISNNVDFDVRLDVGQTTVNVFVNDALTIDHTFADNITNGQIGLANRNSRSAFDDVLVTKSTGSGDSYTEDFNDGTAEDFTPIAGSWSVIANRYEVQSAPNALAISLLDHGLTPSDQISFEATLNIVGGPGLWTNGYLVFDYVSQSDFKFVMAAEGQQEWRIGHYNGAWNFLDTASSAILTNTDYDTRVELDQDTAALYVNDVLLASHSFSGSITDGQIGLANRNSRTEFDDVSVNNSTSSASDYNENFSDGVADGFTVATGQWTVSANRYEGLALGGGTAISLLDPGFALGDQFTFEAEMNIIGGGALWTNGMLVFDYISPTNFKFVQAAEGRQEWRIGQYNGSDWDFLEDATSTILTNTDYLVRIEIDQNSVDLFVDDVLLLSENFGGSITDGQIGLANRNSRTAFDNVHAATNVIPPTYSENFNDTVADDFTAVAGNWNIQGTSYRGQNIVNDVAVSVLTLPVSLGSSYTFASDFRISPLTGQWTNAMLIFDYQSPTDFKFVHMAEGAGLIRIGHYDGTFNFLAQQSAIFNINQDYSARIEVAGDQVTAYVDNIQLVSHTFTGQDLSNGQLGLGNRFSTVLFDNVEVYI